MTDTTATTDTPKAFMQLEENTYVRTIWYVSCTDFDVLGWMFRTPGKPWDIGYRFRHYVDRGDPFSGRDRKSGYVIKPAADEPTEAELASIADKLEVVFCDLARRQREIAGRGEMHRIECNCLGAAAAQLITMQDWGHGFHAGQTSVPGKSPRGSA